MTFSKAEDEELCIRWNIPKGNFAEGEWKSKPEAVRKGWSSASNFYKDK